MADEIAKMLIASSPIAAVLLLLGTTAIQVWKDDLAERAKQRIQIEARLSSIEKQLGIVYPPTP